MHKVTIFLFPFLCRSRVFFLGLVFLGLLAPVEPSAAALRIYYIRHGESGANVKKDWAGKPKEEWPDYVGNADAFSPLGETQIAAVANKLRQYHFDFIAVSPIWRARHTILPYLKETGLKAELWPELAEFSQSSGAFDYIGKEGLPAAGPDLLKGTPIVLPEEEKPYFNPVEAELFTPKVRKDSAEVNAADVTELQKRVIARIKERFGDKDASILLVGHGNAGRALAGTLTGNDDAMKRHIDNTAIWMAEEQPDGSFRVVMYNDKPYQK